jgi:hypothetical protein
MGQIVSNTNQTWRAAAPWPRSIASAPSTPILASLTISTAPLTRGAPRRHIESMPSRLGISAAGLVLALACTAEVLLVPASESDANDSLPGATDTTGTDTTVARRATLYLTVRVATADTAIARLLGWTDGVIAGATVKGFRIVGGQALDATTDAQGRASFPDILEGIYRVSVSRPLSGAERALLGPEHADKVIFSGAELIPVSAPSSAVELAATIKARAPLVISEVFPATWTGSETYRQGTFLEVYNNSDTTIYLDGKLFGIGPFFDRNAPEYDRPCSVTQQWQADSNGLWTPLVYRFPGGGREYPLAAGEAAVLATDAVNHRVVDPRWPDLSSARFEFIGPADVDNPAAANMQLLESEFSDPAGHGWRFGSATYFVADYVDLATLPRVTPPNYRTAIPRIPRDKILDVVTLRSVPEFYEQYGFQLCDVQISPVFDAGPAFLLDPGEVYSVVRLVAGATVQVSRSTVSDFVVVPSPTPGRVP